MSLLTSPGLSPINHIPTWLHQLLLELREKKQRMILSVQGEQCWCDEFVLMLNQQPGCSNSLLLSNRSELPGSIALSKTETLLGSEADLVLVDLYSGMNPDIICIASGLVNCGGLLILLSGNLNNWRIENDPYGIWQDASIASQAVFVDYFFKRVSVQVHSCLTIRADENLPQIPVLEPAKETLITNAKTEQQANVIDKISGWLKNTDQPLALITSDRGRGKSTCLGFVAKKVITETRLKLIVSAYSRLSAAILMKRAGDARFIAPDELIKNPLSCDLLIIDEAAMLSFSMLKQLCQLYPKVLMATTTGGYEGTGRGFMLRFIAAIADTQILKLKLSEPVRWASGDKLEACLNQVLLLNSEPISEVFDLHNERDKCLYRVVKIKDCDDLEFLSQVYRLMISAHYRTRPSDLRMLMENPDLSLVVAERSGVLVGVVLLNFEGGFSAQLSEQVFLGERRPKGHLLAQMITAQASVRHFACYRGLRVQRIAVLDSQRRTGIGSQLIETARNYARSEGIDYLGASFALDAETLPFWRHCQFELGHIGFSPGKSSGNRSVAVLSAINPELDIWIGRLGERIRRHLAVWLSQFLQDMAVDIVVELIRFSQYKADLDELDKNEIEAFLLGHKGFELCFASLQAFVMQAITQNLDDLEVDEWLVEKLVLNLPWEKLAGNSELKGRKAIQRELRVRLKALVDKTI